MQIVKLFDIPKNIIDDNERQRRVYSTAGIASTILARSDQSKILLGKGENMKIRKLTPKECFRLMGVKDNDFENIAQNQSKQSLYHLAGDSIATTCLMAILSPMIGVSWLDKFNHEDWCKK